MAEYRKGTLVQRGDQWYVWDELDRKEARIPEEMTLTFSGKFEPDAEVEYIRSCEDKESNNLIVEKIQLVGEIQLLPIPVGKNASDGFINPYNFVPLFGRVPRAKPTSHECFRSYSGRLTCTLTTKTPFFIPDSEEVNSNQDDHITLALLRDDQGRGLIPGSALKGMFRSVAEVLSSSCLSVVDLDARFSWRNVEERQWRNYWRNQKVGVVQQLPVDTEPGKIASAKSARIYFKHLPENCKDNDPATTEIEAASKGRYKVNRQASLGHTGQGKPGYLKITEVPEDGNKKSQRFIYDIDENTDHWLPFDAEAEHTYNLVTDASRKLDARQHRLFRLIEGKHYTEADQGNPGRGLRRKRHRLEVGDIVYYVIEDNIVRLGPVELSRVLYDNGVETGVPEDFRPCTEQTNLCPCCRIFGWIPPSCRDHEREKEEARAGFVSISPALTENKLTNEDVHEAQAILKPLGQPHASAMNFYLCQPDDVEKIGNYNKPPFQIRGRKIYWHQKGNYAAYTDSRDNSQPKRDSQNKTVELLKTETVFHFDISFENLNAAELGLLLVSVQPSLLGNHQFYHKIGMGKPIGLGSADVSITHVELINRAQRYCSLWETGIEQFTNGPQATSMFLDGFVRQALHDQLLTVPNDNQQACVTLTQLPHIETLLLMLEWNYKPEGVKYPPGPSDKIDESFRWFMQFKNKPEGRLLTPQEIIGINTTPKRQPTYLKTCE